MCRAGWADGEFLIVRVVVLFLLGFLGWLRGEFIFLLLLWYFVFTWRILSLVLGLAWGFSLGFCALVVCLWAIFFDFFWVWIGLCFLFCGGVRVFVWGVASFMCLWYGWGLGRGLVLVWAWVFWGGVLGWVIEMFADVDCLLVLWMLVSCGF